MGMPSKEHLKPFTLIQIQTIWSVCVSVWDAVRKPTKAVKGQKSKRTDRERERERLKQVTKQVGKVTKTESSENTNSVELKRYEWGGWGTQWREEGWERWIFRVKERVGGSSQGRQQGYTVKSGRGEESCLWRNVAVFSVGDGMEWLHYQVLERGERRTRADISFRLHYSSATKCG